VGAVPARAAGPAQVGALTQADGPAPVGGVPVRVAGRAQAAQPVRVAPVARVVRGQAVPAQEVLAQPGCGQAAHAVAAVRAAAGLARADSARAGGIPGAVGTRNAPALLATVLRAVGRAPVGRGPRPAVPRVRGPVVTVAQAGRPSRVKAGAGLAARRRVRAARGMPPTGGPGGRRARQPSTQRAARAGHRATGHHGPAAYLTVQRQRGPRTAAESAKGVSPRVIPGVPIEPKVPTELKVPTGPIDPAGLGVQTGPRVPTEPIGPVGLRARAGAMPARPATTGPRGQRIGARVAAGAEVPPGAEAPAAARRAVGEHGPAMKVGQTGPRADATRRVPPTIAGAQRVGPGPGPGPEPEPGPAVPAFPPVIAAPRLDPDPFQRMSRGSPVCRYPTRSPLTSLIPKRGLS